MYSRDSLSPQPIRDPEEPIRDPEAARAPHTSNAFCPAKFAEHWRTVIRPDVAESAPLYGPIVARWFGSYGETGGLPPTALVMDYDDTFFVEGLQGKSLQLISYARDMGLPIIQMTGNNINFLHQKNLKNGLDYETHVVIGAVGTQILVSDSKDGYITDKYWENYLRDKIGFDYQTIHSFCEDALEQARLTIPNANLVFQPRDTQENLGLYGLPGLYPDHFKTSELGPDLAPEPFKISLNFDGVAYKDEILRLFDPLVSQFPALKIVVCFDSFLDDGRQRLNLDIIPVTKREAVSYVLEQLGCAGVVCGNSGNDLAVLKNTTDPRVMLRIAVAGSTEALIKELKGLATCPGYGELITDPSGKLFMIDCEETRRGPESILHGLRLLSEIFDRN